MSEFCRCCNLSPGYSGGCRKCYSIFKNAEHYPYCQEFVGFDVLQALFDCAQVKISEDDGLSSLICSACLAKLEVCVKFRRQVIESELKQRTLANKPDLPLIVYKPILVDDETIRQKTSKKRKKEKTKQNVDMTDEDEVVIIEESDKLTEQLNLKISDIRSLNDQISNDDVEEDCMIINDDSTESNTDLFLRLNEHQESHLSQQQNLIEISPLESHEQNIRSIVPDDHFIAPESPEVYVESEDQSVKNVVPDDHFIAPESPEVYVKSEDQNIKNIIPDDHFIAPESPQVYVESGDQNIENIAPDERIFVVPEPTKDVESTKDANENYRKKIKLSQQSLFRCDMCFKQFISLDLLSIHKTQCVVKTVSRPTRSSCKTCWKIFDFHPGSSCAHCKPDLTTQGGLVCGLCSKPDMVFETLNAVNAHIKFHHAPGVNFTTLVVPQEDS